eukprot:1781990-Pyramimonas_sp.AAC.1
MAERCAGGYLVHADMPMLVVPSIVPALGLIIHPRMLITWGVHSPAAVMRGAQPTLECPGSPRSCRRASLGRMVPHVYPITVRRVVGR